MSWRFPPEKPKTYWTLDPDQISHNMHAFAEEVGGRLNEHNWTADALPSVLASNWSPRIGGHWWHDRVDTAPTPGGGLDLDPTTRWASIGNLTETVQTRGGVFLVIFSGQVNNDSGAGIKQPGLQFAILVNGQPMHDSLVGSGDMSNDMIDAGAGQLSAVAPVYNYDGTGPAVRSEAQAMTVSWQGYLPPGQYEITAGYRNVSTTNQTIFQEVCCRELIILETNALGRG